MDNKNSQKLLTYRGSYLVAGTLFFILFAFCMTLFNLVTYEASGAALNITNTVAYVFAVTTAVIASFRCSKANKLKNPDIFVPKRDTFYYFKQIAFFTLMIVLMSVAASMVGMAATWVLGGIFYKINHPFLSEFLLKLPFFILYLSLGYKMFVRFGFLDSQKKMFNPNTKLLAVVIAIFILIPRAVGDNYFHMSPFYNDGVMNVQTVLGPNEGVYIMENDGYREQNEEFGAFSVVSIGASLIAAFAAQTAVFIFAYKRGKQIFIKQHIRELDEYEMDENI